MTTHFLSAEWRDLLMLNFEADPALLQPLVPYGTELDDWNGRTFVSIVGFRFLRARLFGLAIPFHGAFNEVNLRFYVRRQADQGWRRGVVFIKEIVPKIAVAAVARLVYGEHFAFAPVHSRIELPKPERGARGVVEYQWGGSNRVNSASAEIEDQPMQPVPSSLEQFIAEHYWAYSKRRDGSTAEYRVEHPSWRIWPATSVRWDCDLVNCYGVSFAETLGHRPTSAFVADGSAVQVFRGEKGMARFAHVPETLRAR